MNLLTNKSFNQCLITCFLVAAAIITWRAPDFKTLANASLKWTKTDGTIESSKLVEVKTSSSRTFDPKISYRYSFENQPYQNTTISFPAPVFQSSEQGAAFISDYPPRKIVSMFVNPQLPSQSCLVAGDNGSNNQIIGPAVWMFLAILVFLLPRGLFPDRRF